MTNNTKNHKDDVISSSMFDMVQNVVKSKPDDLPLYKIRDQPGKPPYNQFVCLGCGQKQSKVNRSFSSCAQCHAVKYCCKECQVNDWKGQGQGPTKPRKHKELCTELKQVIQEFELHPTAGQRLRTQVFLWANQHHPDDKSFHLHEFLERRRLLGGASKGFWAIPDVTTPYHTSGKDRHGFQNGQMLLQPAFPTMSEGWTAFLNEDERIDVTQQPLSNFLSKTTMSAGLQSWEDYLKFRNLPPTSIAPLLMTNVLTIYHMIQNVLQLPALEKPLLVYVLGVESELNQIPLLQELTHLLPTIDLELVYLSPAAKAICDTAAQQQQQQQQERQGNNSLLSNNTEYVLNVQNEATKRRLRVKLDKTYSLYGDVPYDDDDEVLPDAVLALNAGLGAYPLSWAPAIHKMLRMGTPFCCSDQTHLMHRFTETNWLPSVVDTMNRAFPDYAPLKIPSSSSSSIALNPFHGIVNRDVSFVLAPNIFPMVIYLLTVFPDISSRAQPK